MTFNVAKSLYFHQYSTNLSPSKCEEKVNIPIFTIMISCSPSASNHRQGYNKSNSHFSTQNLLHPIRSFQEGVILP